MLDRNIHNITFKIVEHAPYKSGPNTFRDHRVETYRDGEFYTDTQFGTKAAALRWKKSQEDFFKRNPGAYL